MKFRFVFWDVMPFKIIIIQGSTSQKTYLNFTFEILFKPSHRPSNVYFILSESHFAYSK
jgi:hypothetical protein